MSVCEDEVISTKYECRFIRNPVRPLANGSCPNGFEKIEGVSFSMPTCLKTLPPTYTCDSKDPRLCFRPRVMMMTTTHPPLALAYKDWDKFQ